MNWFDVDKDGLRAIVERRGKSGAILELLQNALDASPKKVSVQLKSIKRRSKAFLRVEDDSTEGWANLDDAFTLFAPSSRASSPMKRGRFNLGEKLVLSMALEACLETMAGTLTFGPTGRRRNSVKRDQGTVFEAVMKMSRADIMETLDKLRQVIPPAGVTIAIEGFELQRSEPLEVFEVVLPTEFADEHGNLHRTRRKGFVEVFDGPGGIWELGMPVVEEDWPWSVNVIQKVPLSMERDNVTPAFRRALRAAVLNRMASRLDDEQVNESWVTEAASEPTAEVEAVSEVVKKRFGDRAVIATVGDPMANATAESQGYTVVHGGAMPKKLWAKVRDQNLMQSSAQAFPTPTTLQRVQLADQVKGKCPLCGSVMTESGS